MPTKRKFLKREHEYVPNDTPDPTTLTLPPHFHVDFALCSLLAFLLVPSGSHLHPLTRSHLRQELAQWAEGCVLRNPLETKVCHIQCSSRVELERRDICIETGDLGREIVLNGNALRTINAGSFLMNCTYRPLSAWPNFAIGRCAAFRI